LIRMKHFAAAGGIVTVLLFTIAIFAVQFISTAVAHAQGAGPANAPVVSGVITPLLLGSAASMPTGYLVGFFKHAYPQAGGRSLVIVAILAGLVSSLLMTMLAGGVQTTQVGIATFIIQGIGAAALSAGVGATNSSGDAKRTEVATS